VRAKDLNIKIKDTVNDLKSKVEEVSAKAETI
jgi:hypothetical protein